MIGHLSDQGFTAQLTRGADAPRSARDILRTWTGTTLRPEQLDTARLLVSELVANAVIHGQGFVTLRAWLRTNLLRVEVRDQGPGFVHDGRRPQDAITGGWGLQLVSGQASRWGIGGDCARVWFELDLAPPAADGLPYRASERAGSLPA